ncbi:hypothetical protein ABEP17_14430 [Priestia flexa]|uniref:hypothetical protein n=1 Tax=Priestia flexa TaxID=86664 RepID=UPI003D29077D
MLKGFFDAISDHRSKKAKQSEYDHLEETEYLYSSDYLSNLYKRSNNKEQCYTLLEYMDKFEVNEPCYKGYNQLYKRIDNQLHPQEEEYIKIPKSILMDYLREEES